ncbi:MAG: NAD(P)(+) transhydrogenase (Re/Si-specific) subunit beta [Myxococcales bacterium]|nr:NAD(P)(+) transhydrogenase (Re/Si-specific) subunit beta [Myxococcales bacterium]
MLNNIINLAYLVASVFFILGIKLLGRPKTAVRGNAYGAIAMFIAVLVTLLDQRITSFGMILAGIAVGSLVGAIVAVKVPMTAMPQLVALLNGFGGAASTLVAATALYQVQLGLQVSTATFMVATVASGLIGTVTLTGSFIAFAKLQELKWVEKIPAFAAQQALNAVLALAAVACGVVVGMDPTRTEFYWYLVAISSVLGVGLVIPIGGADMPVVISLLNSYSGIAASATGFVLNNNVLIIAGSLVGASGIILTNIMCKAMNRSLTNVLFAKFAPGASGGKAKADEVYGGKVKSSSPEEVAMLFDSAQRVVVVPGYGLAVAQAQHVVRDLANLLKGRGITVEFGIHPVAGRMPGHMNVLLAEADIPYDLLVDMDTINPTFQQTDVVLVIGANDVVNPVARTDPKSPIAGMPILEVDKARTVVVVKRSLSPGFAGIPNPLFAADNCLMLFGDGKKALVDLVQALKEG